MIASTSVRHCVGILNSVLGLVLQTFKIVPTELKVGTITDAIVCRMAASHC